jgi:hypothetical protein
MRRWIVVLLLLTTGCGAAKEATSPSMRYRGGGAKRAAHAETISTGAGADRDADGIADQVDQMPNAPVPPASPAPPPPPAQSGQRKPPAGGEQQKRDESMLVYTATATVAVNHVDQALASVEKMAREMGGYLAQRSDQVITIRVPRARFREALTLVEQIGDVLHRNVMVEDVTDQYVDMETRLKNARALRDRLQALLKNAPVKEALEIEKELGRITGEIEALESKLKLLREKLAFSTITVTFQPQHVEGVNPTPVLPFEFLESMGLGPLLQVH